MIYFKKEEACPRITQLEHPTGTWKVGHFPKPDDSDSILFGWFWTPRHHRAIQCSQDY